MSNLLIITSSGGGGLLQSAIAMEQEEKKINPNVNIVKRDLLMQWTGGAIGIFGKFFYNWTLRSGKVFFTNLLVKCNLAAEHLFFPLVFFSALRVLFKENIDRVIDNQPMGIGPIIKAIRIYNKFAKKNIVLEKVFVDLPTKEYVQFIKAIKKLSKNDRKYLRITTIEPLLEDEKNYAEYWERHCGLKEDQITYKRYIIRTSFKNFQGVERPKGDFALKIRTTSSDENDLLKKCFSKGSINYKETDEGFSFLLKPEDKLFIILLGSQPSANAILGYLEGFIKEIKDKNPKSLCHLFVFSDKFTKENSLFHKIYNLIEKEENYPKNLTIVPMGFQKDDVIAPLFFRSDLTITRSGGHTIMELMATCKGEKWIHSETKTKDREPTFDELLKGIHSWEAGNARYLNKTMNGDIVSPQTLISRIRQKKIL